MKKYLWLCMAAITLCAGCGLEKQPEVTEEPAITADAGKEITEAPKVTTDVFQTPKKEEEVIQGLKEQMEKKEGLDLEKYNSFNRMMSPEEDKGTSLFCVDEQTGVAYFVNLNLDNFIYRIKDGEVALAVAMPAKELWTLDGTLYFMVESYDKYELDCKDGDIYCYMPESGAVELVYALGSIDENAKWHKLTVAEEGIYFSYSTEKEIEFNGQLVTTRPTYYRYLAFGENEPMEDKASMVHSGTKDFFLYYSVVTEDNPVASELILVSRLEQKNEIALGIGRPMRYCLIGEELYYYRQSTTTIDCLNINTMETIKYDFRDVLMQTSTAETEEEFRAIVETPGAVMLNSFAMTEDYLWAASNLYLYRMDLKSGETVAFRGSAGAYRIDALYTDGEQLYGLYSASVGGGACPVRFLVEEPDSAKTDNAGTDNIEIENMETSCGRLIVEYMTE